MSVSLTVQVGSPHGLHARPATAVVRLANKYSSQINLFNEDNGERADAKSIFDIMMLAARHGAGIVVTAAGDDEDEATRAVSALIASDFGEIVHSGESSLLAAWESDDDDDTAAANSNKPAADPLPGV